MKVTMKMSNPQFNLKDLAASIFRQETSKLVKQLRDTLGSAENVKVEVTPGNSEAKICLNGSEEQMKLVQEKINALFPLQKE